MIDVGTYSHGTYICFPITEPLTAVVTVTTTVTVTTNCTESKGSSANNQKGLSAAVIILALFAFVTTAMIVFVGVVLCRRHANANAARVYTGEQL